MAERLYFLYTMSKDRGSYVIYNVSIFLINSILKKLISCISMAGDIAPPSWECFLGKF